MRTCEQGRTSLVRVFAENPGITPGSGFQTAAFSLAAEKGQPTARVPGAGGCIVLFLLRPLNAGRRLFLRKRHADGFGTFAIKSTEKAATMSRVFCTFFPQKVLIAVCDWCCLPLFGRRLTAVFARGVLCTFWPQKVPKTPRQMPSPTSSRLTFETGAYSRVCKQTGPVSCHF